jgi:hypothetical protein
VSPRFGLVGRTSTLPKNHDGPLRGRRRDQRSASPTAPLRADPDIPSYTTSWDVSRPAGRSAIPSLTGLLTLAVPSVGMCLRTSAHRHAVRPMD